jgi:homopolymeric O-antigen transport system permease protein
VTQVLADLKEMVTEQVHYRELLYQMTKRDLLLRYKQTVMGVGWAVFAPLVNTLIFSVIFTRVAPIDVGVPYPLFAYCGLFAWNLFASSLRAAVSSLTSNTSLVTKVYFPREIFPFSSILVAIVDFAVSSIVLAAMMAWYGISPTSAILLLPIVLVVHVIFTAAMSLLLAMSNLFYRDVKYMFEIILTVWMFASSVLYPVHLVGGRLGTFMYLNPMTPILDGYRSVLLYGQSPFTPAFGAAAVFSILSFTVAWLLFHRAEFRFAENI